MFESIAVLILFMFVVAIGLKFYSNVQLSSLQTAQERFASLDSIKTSILILNLPEIRCSFEGVDTGPCVDLSKLEGLKKAKEDLVTQDIVQAFYFDIFGFSNIYVETIETSTDLEDCQNEGTTDAERNAYCSSIQNHDVNYCNVRQEMCVKRWDLWEQEPSGAFSTYTTPLPVTIYNPYDDTNDLGVLWVELKVPQ